MPGNLFRRTKIKKMLSNSSIASSPFLIVHFGYHKCMTVLFHRVFLNLSQELGWAFRVFKAFEQDQFLQTANDSSDNRILLINNVFSNIKDLPEGFRGSHIIRDPRDILVSAYRYHKWCKERWVTEPIPENMLNNLKLESLGIVEDMTGLSLQYLLNKVDVETGMMIELKIRNRSFIHMLEWDYNHEKILEVRYEDVFENEVQTFMKLFDHYGLNKKQTAIGLKHVERFAFKNQAKLGKTGSEQHLSKGISGQWKEHFFPELKTIFKKRYQDLLIKLGYEKDENW